MEGLGGSAKKIGGAIKGMAVAAGAAVVGGSIVDFAKDTVKAASDAQQSVGATETVFGKFANTVISTSKQAASAYGLSANEYRENANLIGSLFKNQGVSAGELAGKTDELVKKGADLAATFGGTATEAVSALGSAYKGEFDPLERYGISIKQSSVNALLAARGQDKLTGAAKAAAQQQAVTDLIMQQSTGSTGAFAKEADTLAHQQQVLNAKWTDAKATLGSALLPVLTKVFAYMADTALPAVMKFGGWFKDNIVPALKTAGEALAAFGGFLADNVGAVTAFATAIGVLFAVQKLHAAFLAVQAVGGLVAYVAQMNIVQALTKTWAAVQWVLNAAMSANPIGIVVVAIAALIAVIILAWKNSETFRNIVLAAWGAIKTAAVAVFGFVKNFISAAWNAIKSATSAVWNAIKAVVTAVFNAIKAVVMTYFNIYKTIITTAINVIKTVFTTGFNALKGITTTAFNAVKGAISAAISGIKAAVTAIINAIKGVFKGTNFASLGMDLIRGFIGGIKAMASRAGDAAADVARAAVNKVKSILHIGSPSKLFKQFGKWTVEGLAIGLEGTQKVKQASADLANDVARSFGAPQLSASTIGGSGGGVGNTYYLTVQSLDPRESGRLVAEALNDYERRNGGRRL